MDCLLKKLHLVTVVYPMETLGCFKFHALLSLLEVFQSPTKVTEWVVPENIHTIPRAASWNSEGEGGFLGLEF